MTLPVYWWKPTAGLRTLAVEFRDHGSAWANLVLRGGLPRNFGDELTPLLLDILLGITARWAPVARAELIMVGSILNVYASSGGVATILGSGVRSPLERLPTAAQLSDVLLIRGALSRDILGLDDSTPLGDPGLVIAEVVRPSARRAGNLLVPHFAVFGSRTGRSMIASARSSGFRVAAPTLTPVQMAREISASDFVATSSLHALVFAHAYGVPAQLISFGERTPEEPSFKYQDYASAFDVRLNVVSLPAVLTATASVKNQANETAATIDSKHDQIVESITGSIQALRARM